MKVIFTQNCTFSIGNMTVKTFAEGEEFDLEGDALAKALADGRCIPKPAKPAPEENKKIQPVEENKAVSATKTKKK